jgi:uroporphyrinogen decarboxylase
MNERFLRACRRQPVDCTPVWIMRQAGRYLPEYRKVRAASDFLTMCKTPSLAAEVSLQPVDILGVDAAIIFSDILVIPEAMGMGLEMVEGQGPLLSPPIRKPGDISSLHSVDPEKDLRFLLDAIEGTKRGLNGKVPLIGFTGSPWTLASYMVEGRGTRDFATIKEMMIDEPSTLTLLLEKLTTAVRLSLEAQIGAGADAVQIFDTWGGILDPDHYRQFSLDPLFSVISKMQRGNTPVIVFSKGAHHALKDLASIGADVVGLDWMVDIGEVRELIGDKVALQGNLDPSFLYGSPESIRASARSILKKFGRGPGHVFNLGHGILPDTPVDHARALVRAVHEESAPYHV